MHNNLTLEWITLQRADPAIAQHAWDLHQIHPLLNGRALKAGILAVGNAVTKVRRDVYQVASQTSEKVYTVTLNGQGLRYADCNCPDFVMGTRGTGRGAPIFRGTPRCKHILAVAMSPIYKAEVR